MDYNLRLLYLAKIFIHYDKRQIVMNREYVTWVRKQSDENTEENILNNTWFKSESSGLEKMK